MYILPVCAALFQSCSSFLMCVRISLLWSPSLHLRMRACLQSISNINSPLPTIKESQLPDVSSFFLSSFSLSSGVFAQWHQQQQLFQRSSSPSPPNSKSVTATPGGNNSSNNTTMNLDPHASSSSSGNADGGAGGENSFFGDHAIVARLAAHPQSTFLNGGHDPHHHDRGDQQAANSREVWKLYVFSFSFLSYSSMFSFLSVNFLFLPPAHFFSFPFFLPSFLLFIHPSFLPLPLLLFLSISMSS